MTEREKMLAGELYDCGDPELLTQWHKAKDLARDYNQTDSADFDEKELQKTSLLKKELSYLKKQKKIEGYCLFSYQYLDCQNKKYHFDAEQFSTKRKKLLNQIVKSLKNNS